MTFQEEYEHMEELAKLTGVDLETVQRIINAQLALFMAQLATVGHSDTIFGSISIKNGVCTIKNPNTQIIRLSTEFGMTEKLILEFPSSLDNV